jgi:hypothetical protein
VRGVRLQRGRKEGREERGTLGLYAATATRVLQLTARDSNDKRRKGHSYLPCGLSASCGWCHDLGSRLRHSHRGNKRGNSFLERGREGRKRGGPSAGCGWWQPLILQCSLSELQRGRRSLIPCICSPRWGRCCGLWQWGVSRTQLWHCVDKRGEGSLCGEGGGGGRTEGEGKEFLSMKERTEERERRG